MGEQDIAVQKVLWRWIVPGLVGMAALRLFKGQFDKIYCAVYAKIMSNITINLNRKLKNQKEDLFSELNQMAQESKTKHLSLLEIGAGTGANFQFYPEGINVICLDPNPSFGSYLKEKKDSFHNISIQELIIGKSEDLSAFPDDSVDVAVCTLVLCSVDNMQLSLKKIKRVLRPGGKLFFMDHVCADKSHKLYTVQKWVNPVWSRFTDGCSLLKETWKDIESAGFNHVHYEIFDPRLRKSIISRFVKGVATK